MDFRTCPHIQEHVPENAGIAHGVEPAELSEFFPVFQRRTRGSAGVFLRQPVNQTRFACAGIHSVSGYALGWDFLYTSRSRSADTCVYICVVLRLECPSISCTALKSAPASSM